MSFTPTVLAIGTIPTTTGALYTVPASTTTYVHEFKVLNTNSTTQAVIIYLTVGGTTITYANLNSLSQGQSAKILDNPIHLTTGSVISAVTTTGSAVNFIITGVQQQ